MKLEGQLFKMTFHHMAGEFEFSCFPQPLLKEDEVKDLFYKASNEVERIENLLTEFRQSPFQEINDNSGIRPVKVSGEILGLIKKSFIYSDLSNGLFDISFASLGRPWRLKKAEGKFLTDEEISNLSSHINYKNIEINEKESTLYLPHKDMKISLGGIGKGYAVDKTFELLEKAGLINFCVNGSGDIRVHSHKNAPRPWRLGIKNPFTPTLTAGLVEIADGALCTSGDYFNFHQNNKTMEKQSHIIHPKFFQSSESPISVTIHASSALEGDVLATTLMNMNIEEGLKFLDTQKKLGILIDESGKVFSSKKTTVAMEQKLHKKQKGKTYEKIKNFFHFKKNPTHYNDSPQHDFGR